VSSVYDRLNDDDDDVEPIDYTIVSHYAKEGLKNPRMIAHAMGLPVDWFTNIYKDKINLAIERGLAELAFETTGQVRENAREGDFQAQKYILQNIDPTWTDKKEVVNTNEIDIKSLPSLRELFQTGLDDMRDKLLEEKAVNSIEGEANEVGDEGEK